jgi:hypothetical protein
VQAELTKENNTLPTMLDVLHVGWAGRRHWGRPEHAYGQLPRRPVLMPVVSRRPIDVPEMKIAVRNWMATGGARWQMAASYREDPRDQEMDWLEGESVHVADARSYWVTREMVDLLEGAAKTFPLDSPSPILDCDHGFLVWQRPIRPHPGEDRHMMCGVYWRNAVAVLLMLDPDELSRVNCISPPFDIVAAPSLRDTWPPHVKEVWRWIAACMTLMTQRIAVQSQLALDRAGRRRIMRGAVLDDALLVTRVVDLRRPTTSEVASPVGAPVSWSHRWIVDGHWRNQWMPKTGTHRPMWIAPHVKGPDDRPLVVRDRVYRWKR